MNLVPSSQCKTDSRAETQRRRERQNQDFGALACEKPFQASDCKEFLVLTGEAENIHGFLCASAPPRDALVLGLEFLSFDIQGRPDLEPKSNFEIALPK